MSRCLTEKKLLIGTHNQGKFEDFKVLLADYGLELVSAKELGLPDVEETGSTFEENARLKALTFAKHAQLPAIADDSGLCVDALDGQPGIHTARWAGPERDCHKGMEKIRSMIHALPTEKQSTKAHFVSCVALAWPDGHMETITETADFVLVWPPRGDHGFGYDAFVCPVGESKTYGELTHDEKLAVNPRSKALRKLMKECVDNGTKMRA
ncbi:MAG: non-canonical purine NTP pyrophosphatase [Alphaproteobacteria bacterium]|jgi:XTP/dITP diphosphohydrolase|nr:non-canonical purine NTP pyrophosphatase [Alphaproteobacteria bacterium]MBT5389103.1 non-canonical purine NTP pyrophosphatase [Alphaproteobacteria bacterium]MBT5541095.1 non-canonical purine NTP pyrophosphatase [Alphaproteobacteria bacterium]MBT5654315.1 non-canonical purine NTP pyrophosphatase [Alphaproteobacteria bacterium]